MSENQQEANNGTVYSADRKNRKSQRKARPQEAPIVCYYRSSSRTSKEGLGPILVTYSLVPSERTAVQAVSLYDYVRKGKTPIVAVSWEPSQQFGP